MASVQRIFPRLNTPALSFVRHPAGVFGAWDQAALVYSGQGARYVGPFQGSVQVQAVPAFAAVPMATTQNVLIAQLLGDPLRAATIPAGNWSIGFALQLANAGAMFSWGGVASLFVVDGLTGERRATIFDVELIGSNGRTVTTERTCLASIAGFGVQLRTGDFLCLEIGMEVNNAAAALVPQASLFADGTGPITVDDIAATSAGSVLEAPVELLLSLPQPGEQPTASVSHDEAVLILKDHWPPYSETLYDWDDPATTVHGFMEALGDVVKVYGFDQSDRLVREVNTLLTVELLPVWEGALGIVLSAAAMRSRTADQRRQVVIARLREVGPLTLFALAAIFGQLANYAPGTTPEVLELDATTERTHNEYTDSIANAETVRAFAREVEIGVVADGFVEVAHAGAEGLAQILHQGFAALGAAGNSASIEKQHRLPVVRQCHARIDACGHHHRRSPPARELPPARCGCERRSVRVR